jgi:hypothetical protein
VLGAQDNERVIGSDGERRTQDAQGQTLPGTRYDLQSSGQSQTLRGFGTERMFQMGSGREDGK